MVFERKPNGKLTAVVAGMLLLAGLVWSKSRPAGPGVVAEARTATASAISPMDLMLKHRGRLATENWESF
jgi:hypothetical protein